MGKNLILPFIIFISFLLTACGASPEGAKEVDYEKTKKMIVDILQTEDGRRALSEVLNDDAMKERLVIDSDTVRDAIKEELLTEKGKEVWVKYFEDPVFVASFSQAMEKAHIDLFKQMMKEADFQKQMTEILQDPALSEHYLSLLKSQAFREHTEKLIEEAMNQPAFLAKVKQMTEDKQAEEAEKKEESAGSDKGS